MFAFPPQHHIFRWLECVFHKINDKKKKKKILDSGNIGYDDNLKFVVRL